MARGMGEGKQTNTGGEKKKWSHFIEYTSEVGTADGPWIDLGRKGR